MCDFDNLGETVKFNSHLNSNFMSNCQHQQHLSGVLSPRQIALFPMCIHIKIVIEKLEISKLILENPLWQEGNSPNRIGFNFVMTLCRGYFWISSLTLGYEMRPNLSINRKRIFWVWKVKSIKISDLLEWRHKLDGWYGIFSQTVWPVRIFPHFKGFEGFFNIQLEWIICINQYLGAREGFFSNTKEFFCT